MTALANRLFEIAGSIRNFADVADGCVITEVVNSIPAMRVWADELDELRAALSPAELGGVEGPLRVFSEGAWVYEETGQRFRARDLDEAAFAEYLRHPLSTPRAAEAEWLPIESAPKDATYWLVWSAYYQRPVVVTQRRDDNTFWEGDWDFDVQATHWTASLTPPSAKGEL